MRAILMFQQEVMDKVTRQCPQTTTFLKRKESRSGIEPRSFRLPALPLGQTGSRYILYQTSRLCTQQQANVSAEQVTFGVGWGGGGGGGGGERAGVINYVHD